MTRKIDFCIPLIDNYSFNKDEVFKYLQNNKKTYLESYKTQIKDDIDS